MGKSRKNWFQPDYNWIKKYKTTYTCYNELKIKYSERDKKGDLVERLSPLSEMVSLDPIELLKNVK